MSSSLRAVRRRRRRTGRAEVGGRSRRRKAVSILIGVLLFGFFGTVLLAGGTAVYGFAKYNDFVSDVRPPEELLAELPRGGARIYDRNGRLLYEFVDELGGLRRPVPLSQISPWLIDATIATEDASFWNNNGLNVRGLARAAWENFAPLGGDPFTGSGGSSITQQLAKNVYIPREERFERSPERKLKEAAIALELTDRYEKTQILEWYLNSISYGGIYVGIEAASEGYFGKSASELTLAEAALLAGIPQQPAAYDPTQNAILSKARQSEVLDLMVRHNRITPAQAEQARDEPIILRQARFDIDAPHFVLGRVAREIRERFGEQALYQDGLEVTTTLDMDLQEMAQGILEGWIREYEASSDGHNGAFYALDAKTGEILVYIGSRDYFNDDILGRNDNVTALNSPGSTLKPFTYMTAFMRGWNTGTGILDTPTRVIDPSTGEFFTPRNPGTGYQGVITAAEALGNSLNVTALKAILYGGVENTLDTLRQVGFTTLDNPNGYGPALTLGGADITLEDLTYGYSVLANRGIMRGQPTLEQYDPGERTVDPVALLKVADSEGNVLYEYKEPTERRVIPESFTYLVTSIISDGRNQCITFGACNALGLNDRPSAQKTGTSEPFDNDRREIGETWAVGYTPQLVAGVWFGNSDNSPMVNIVSTSVSWRSFRDFMNEAHTALELPPEPFERPPGVVEMELCWPSGMLPTEDCPQDRRYKGLFAADVLGSGDPPEELYDTWWQKVRIDTRNGLLAAETTPSQFVADEVRLVLPEDEIEGWTGLNEWAAKNGLAGKIAPTADSATVGSYAQVLSPGANATLNGVVQIVGRAASPNFQQYAVEYGRGSNPSSWVRLNTSNRPTVGTELGVWNTTLVPNGEYTLRVSIQDEQLGELWFAVPVRVDNGSSGATQDLTPVAQINGPVPGAVVSGNVQVRGTAAAADMLQATLEIGVGLSPSTWQTLTSTVLPVYQGDLYNWDTTSVADGIYTLRLTVQDRTLGASVTSVVLTVKNEE
ncbi:MAG: transglycosylase domain-containing protein [Dehalococcoidia bacterium]